MTTSGMIDAPQTSPGRSAVAALRAWSAGRTGLLAIAGVAIVAGLFFNWSLLVAIGVAPLIIGFLPCAAMCALGFCMMNMSGKKTSPDIAASPLASDSTGLPQLGSPEGLDRSTAIAHHPPASQSASAK